jgi:hypothetical protein
MATIRVLFTEPGSLGLKLGTHANGGGVEILKINPGTQAQRYPGLLPGLVLQSISSLSVVGMAHNNVIDVIRAHPGRPLEIEFIAKTPGQPKPGVPPSSAVRTAGRKKRGSMAEVQALREGNAPHQRPMDPPEEVIEQPEEIWHGNMAIQFKKPVRIWTSVAGKCRCVMFLRNYA